MSLEKRPVPSMYHGMNFIVRRLLQSVVIVTAAWAALGTTVVPLEFGRLVDLSEQVVRGTVIDVRCAWRTFEDSRFIVTLVTIRVDETVVGKPAAALELQFLGGTLDGETLKVAGQPQFQIGDEDILFVAGNGRSICPLVAMAYGRILVVPGPGGEATVARDNGAPILALADMGTPMTEARVARSQRATAPPASISAEDFCAAIREHAVRQGRTDLGTR
jgi:hypothetical protein